MLVLSIWCWSLFLIPPCAGLARRKVSGDDDTIDVHGRYVHYPRPTLYEDIAEQETQERDGMQAARTKDFNVSVMIYSDLLLDQSISYYIKKWGRWEWNAVKNMCGLWLKHGRRGTFVDAGANIGALTMPLARCLDDGGSNHSLISVEPFLNNTRRLRAGIKYNRLKNVHLYEYALGAPDATDVAAMEPHKTNQGMTRVRSSYEKKSDYSGVLPLVNITTLDSIVVKEDVLGQVFALKLDVEGYEMTALRGAEALMASPPCVVFVEAGHIKKHRKAVLGYFQERGYEYWGDGVKLFPQAAVEADGAASRALFEGDTLEGGGGNDVFMVQRDLDACAARMK